MKAKSTKSRTRRHPRGKAWRRRRSQEGLEGVVDLRSGIREALLSQLRSAVISTAEELVREEVVSLVGEPWSRKGDSPLRRGGSTTARIFLDGQPCSLRRGRVRDRDQRVEVPLQRVQALQSRDALDEDVKRLLIRGVSTRQYDGAVAKLSEGMGLHRSAVSAAFQRAARKDLDALNGRSLKEWTFVAVYLDATSFKETTCVVALGISEDGRKRILGVREGATENATLVSDLLSNLRERGLRLTAPRALFVIDGSKALRRAIRDSFGSQAVIARCHLHKLRNVTSYLPSRWQAEARRRIRAAWGMAAYEDAREELGKVVRWLEAVHEAAANSLREGLEETLTIHRLAVTGALRRTLVTTNPIESAFDTVKTHARRVKRWRGSSMALRWIASGLVKAEEKFRRVKGHRSIPKLVLALETLSVQDLEKSA